MTDTKTKPHGYVSKTWQSDLKDYDDICMVAEQHPLLPLPVCLVSPALLDRIAKVRWELAEIALILVEPEDDQLRTLVAELEAIEKEFKS